MTTIIWSYSGMKNFQGCPLRYHEVNVLKNYPFVDTPQTIYGKQVHSAIEDYFVNGVVLPNEHQKFSKTVEMVSRINGEKHCELKLAVNRDQDPCEFFDKNAWVRGVVDLLIISEDGMKAIIIDWKTGSNRYPDNQQLELMFLLVRSKFPNIRYFDCYLVFLAHGVRTHSIYTLRDTGDCWDYWESQYQLLSDAFESNSFLPKPSPLCGWCPVVTCKFQRHKKPIKVKTVF